MNTVKNSKTKALAFVNGVTTEVLLAIDNKVSNYIALQEATEQLGYPWADSTIVVPNFPRHGDLMHKPRGEIDLFLQRSLVV